jgi:hypothetical protein
MSQDDKNKDISSGLTAAESIFFFDWCLIITAKKEVCVSLVLRFALYF